jgi:hypothetical protein
VLRGSRGDAAGTESGSSFIERIIVNTGTVLVSPVFRASSLGASAGRIDRRSVQDAAEPPQYFEPGKPRYMGKGDSGYREGKDTSVPFDPGNCQFLPVLEWNCQRRNGNDNSSRVGHRRPDSVALTVLMPDEESLAVRDWRPALTSSP